MQPNTNTPPASDPPPANPLAPPSVAVPTPVISQPTMNAQPLPSEPPAATPLAPAVEPLAPAEPHQTVPEPNPIEGEDMGIEVRDEPPPHRNPLISGLLWYWRRKWISLPLTLVALLGLVYAIPDARYAAAGWAVKRNVGLLIKDSQTGDPVSAASVTIDGVEAKTNAAGRATLAGIPAGFHEVTIAKKHYKQTTTTIEVELYRDSLLDRQLVATGRQIIVKVAHRLTGNPITGSTITLDEDTTAITNDKGEATLVVPIANTAPKVKVSAKDYLDSSLTLDPVNGGQNSAELVPSGSVLYLSRGSGKIDVVKSNLDGSGRKTVLAGNGTEEDRETVLLASRDWKFAALKAKRDAERNPGLYLVTAGDETVVPIEEDAESITPVGWADNLFVYQTNATSRPQWEAGRIQLKSFDANSRRINLLYESQAVGDNTDNAGNENISNVFITGSTVAFTKTWSVNNTATPEGKPVLEGKESGIMSVAAGGGELKTLRPLSAEAVQYIDAKAASPQSFYYGVFERSGASSLFSLTGGNVESLPGVSDSLSKTYPTYLLAPNGNEAAWSDERDGKFTTLIGNQLGADGKEVLAMSEYRVYGWFGNDYLLLSKGDSELFIISRAASSKEPLKISDYHKPTSVFPGYGGL